MTAPAERGPNPHLVAWLRTFTAAPTRRRCLVIGCGLGDDAEALASAGFEVTAIDASAAVIEAARRRFPRSGVDYVTGDVLNPPQSRPEPFDLVYEACTRDTVPPDARPGVLSAIASLVAPGGRLFVLERTGDEVASFEQAGLRTLEMDETLDDGSAFGLRFRAFFDRPLA
jgi:2-polyprenyl-3-methyl-5-hydroxy-6-metoxy-1,4-benzoquinol methylase